MRPLRRSLPWSEPSVRSSGNIVAAANGVVKQNTRRQEKTVFTESGAGAPMGRQR